MHKCILIDTKLYPDRCTKSINGEELILNYIFQLINITLGFGDFHNTQAKLAPAQPFIGPQDGIRIAYPLQKRLNFYFFVTVIVKIVSLIYHFTLFYK